MATNITPGVGQHATITNPTGLAGSVTQNPLTPVEYGETAAKSKYTTVTSSDPLVPEPVYGGVATGTLTGTVSTKGDGTETASATTGGSGNGATVTYTVTSNVASGLSIAAGGSGYLAGEVLTVTGDTGVTVTIATVA